MFLWHGYGIDSQSGPLAQWSELPAHNRTVPGSSPGGSTGAIVKPPLWFNRVGVGGLYAVDEAFIKLRGSKLKPVRHVIFIGGVDTSMPPTKLM